MRSTKDGRNFEQELRQPPRRHGAWLAHAVRTLERAACAVGGHALYRRRHLRRGAFHVRREELLVPGLHRELEGLCCVQLSDLHAGPYLRAGDLADVVAAANAEAPDLVFVTGDLITRDWRDAQALVGDLAALRTRLAALAVFGNHDYRARMEGEIERLLADAGVRVLRNRCARFQLGQAGLAVVGIEDLEEARYLDLEAAREGLRAGDLELALCHHPAGGPLLARPGCAAVFAGHTHGGQLDLPGLRGLGPAHPGLRLRLGATTLFVNRGLGTIAMPLRLGAPTELLVVRLCAGECG